MKQIMLTNKEINAIQGTGKPQRILDRDNLYILVNAQGTTKSWQFRYRRPADNKADIYSIGRYPDISIKEARLISSRLSYLIYRGYDPKKIIKDKSILPYFIKKEVSSIIHIGRTIEFY